jgi:hypothetical protein
VRAASDPVSQNDTNRRSAIDARTTRHPGYRISTIRRKRTRLLRGEVAELVLGRHAKR